MLGDVARTVGGTKTGGSVTSVYLEHGTTLGPLRFRFPCYGHGRSGLAHLSNFRGGGGRRGRADFYLGNFLFRNVKRAPKGRIDLAVYKI